MDQKGSFGKRAISSIAGSVWRRWANSLSCKALLKDHGSVLEAWSNSLAKYGDRGWSSNDLARIILLANEGEEPDQADLTWLKDKTSLLPPKLLTQLDESRLVKERPETENPPLKKVETAELNKILTGRFTDEEFESVFPARTKIDLGIRRARARTVYQLYKNTGRLDEWKRWIPQLVNFDYITAVLLMLFEHIHGNWLRFWARFQCLNSLDDLQKITKWVSDRLKKEPASMEMRLRYCEGGGVSGYRNPPFGNFDFIGETGKLADGGEEHGLMGDDWMREFGQAADRVQGTSQPKKVDYMSLRDFIESDLATTGGASTFGKVEWEFEGEKGKFKARKNFLLDITTADYLAEQTMQHLGRQVNKSFLKPELGKMRIAVTGDIWTYFSQSWLNYLAGSVYLQWPGNTMDERVDEQAKRMTLMLETAKGGYGLPFDFAGFDHQPETLEVQTLTRKYLERGRANVPFEHLETWRNVLEKTISSFDNAKLIAREGSKVAEFDITGGVESGIRLTSLLGNYWNSTVTNSAKEVLRRAGLKEEIPSWLRGDDSALYGRSYWTVLAMRLAYAGVNAIGNDSKYGIHFEQSEFLRVWYADRCYGYPNRAIPGLIQRKPWNSEPWDPEGVLKAQLSTIYTLERRLQRDLPELRTVVVQDWTRIRKRSARWLEVPTTLGGLGLLPFTGWLPSKPWAVPNKPEIKFTNVKEGSWEHYRKGFERWSPTSEELKSIQHSRMIAKAAADDIRGMGRVFRENYQTALERVGNVEWKRVDLKPFPTDLLTGSARVLGSLDSPTQISQILQTAPAMFGRYRKEMDYWKRAVELSQFRKGFKPLEAMDTYCPFFRYDLKHLERKGLHRASALDYLFGTIGGLVVGKLSTLLTSIVEVEMAKQVELWTSTSQKWNRDTWGWFTSTVAHWFGTTLDQSPLAKRLFQW